MINILNLLLTLASILNAVSALPLTSMVKTNATSKAATASTADGYAVKSLPGLEKMDPKFVPEMHAGYIEIDPSTKEDYFFWKFSKIHEDSKADNRLIFWFNGGPGCSSMDGALEETGPLTVNDQGEVEYRAGSWLENGNLVFIDQPVGTGFSTGDKDAAELINIASDMLTFIKKYLGLFPEDAKKEIYLSGESYAGQYVPYFGAKILMDAPEINLQGLVIVNGYIYPDVQDSALIDFAYENQLISSSGVQQAQDDVQQCLEDIDQNIKEYGEIYSQIEKYGEYQGSKNTMGSSQNKISSDSCANLLYDVLQLNYTANAPADEKCMNMYDFALRDSYPSCGGENFPVGESTLTSFLRSSEVDSALHIQKGVQWSQCSSSAVYNSIKNTYSYPAFFKFPYILSKIKIMVMAGENDVICNKKGLETMVTKLTWGGKSSAGFSDSISYADFSVNNSVYGELKVEDNFFFAGVHNASHMVPYSQPFAARALLDIFLGNYKMENGKYVAPDHGDF